MRTLHGRPMPHLGEGDHEGGGDEQPQQRVQLPELGRWQQRDGHLVHCVEERYQQRLQWGGGAEQCLCHDQKR